MNVVVLLESKDSFGDWLACWRKLLAAGIISCNRVHLKLKYKYSTILGLCLQLFLSGPSDHQLQMATCLHCHLLMGSSCHWADVSLLSHKEEVTAALNGHTGS